MAWLKKHFRGKNIFRRWTDVSMIWTETKSMDPMHAVSMLDRGTLSLAYPTETSFTRTKLSETQHRSRGGAGLARTAAGHSAV